LEKKKAVDNDGDSADIYYVIEGEGLVTIGKEERVLRKGDIVAIPKNPYKKPLIMLDILTPKPKI